MAGRYGKKARKRPIEELAVQQLLAHPNDKSGGIRARMNRTFGRKATDEALRKAAKTLDELAMEYAIVSLGIDPDKAEGVFDLKPKTSSAEWQAEDLKNRMCQQASVYHVDQAIKRALEIVKMVIPENPGDLDD